PPADVKPTVQSVESAQTILDIVRLPDRDRAGPQSREAIEVVRMHRVAGLPLLQLVECLSEVLEHLLVDEVDVASRRQGRHQTCDAVNDQAEPLFALAQRSA